MTLNELSAAIIRGKNKKILGKRCYAVAGVKRGTGGPRPRSDSAGPVPGIAAAEGLNSRFRRMIKC